MLLLIHLPVNWIELTSNHHYKELSIYPQLKFANGQKHGCFDSYRLQEKFR